MMARQSNTRSGVTLIELLVAVMIGAIACLGLSAPMMAERRFWIAGIAQAESQRDAQLAMRAIARVVHEAGQMTDKSSISGGVRYTFEAIQPCGAKVFFARPRSINGNGKFQFQEQCGSWGTWPPVVTLIEGDLDSDGQVDRNETWLTDFDISEVGPEDPSKTIRILARVTYGGVEDELLETTIFMRNWNPEP